MQSQPIHSYRNIIFDLGGVILDINPNRAVEFFAKHVYNSKHTSPKNIQLLYDRIVNGTLLMAYEKGLIDDDEFRMQLTGKLDIELSDKAFDEAFNGLLLDYTTERLQLLSTLKKQHRLYLLSNTCHIHYQHYNNLLQTKYGYKTLGDLFEKMYLSFEVGMRKPDERFFKKVIEDAGINATETVFIDDSLQNIEAARSVGLAGIHKPQEVDLTSLFN